MFFVLHKNNLPRVSVNICFQLILYLIVYLEIAYGGIQSTSLTLLDFGVPRRLKFLDLRDWNRCESAERVHHETVSVAVFKAGWILTLAFKSSLNTSANYRTVHLNSKSSESSPIEPCVLHIVFPPHCRSRQLVQTVCDRYVRACVE